LENDMETKFSEPEFDVIIVGSGVAGALAAHRLVQAKLRVLVLEAGGVAPDSLGRYAMLNNFVGSPPKATDAPFCGDNILANQPDPRRPTLGKNYYDYPASFDSGKDDLFASFYERLVGGSCWHWQGIYIRMLPSDFRMQRLYRGGPDWLTPPAPGTTSDRGTLPATLDWPINYGDIEPWYVVAEKEMGVAGSDREVADYFVPRFGAYRSAPYPMPELVASYLDKQVAKAVGRSKLDGMPLRVTTVPHAINSRTYDGRPACDGRTSCVPLCTIKARYEAIFHVEKAMALGAVLRTQAVVTRLALDESGKRITGVFYKRWQWHESNGGERIPLTEQDEYVSGKIIVLAANGIENPMILLRSNAANSSKLVGCYLMDHPIKQSYALTPQPLYPFRGPQTTSDIEAFRDGAFRGKFAAFKTSIKNDGWSTNATGSPRGGSAPVKQSNEQWPPANEADDWHPGTVLDYVTKWGYFGRKLHGKLADHPLRQITLNSACEQLPIKENSVSLSANTDELKIARPLIKYRVDNDGGYVRASFKKIIELHGRVFDALGIRPEHRKMQEDPDGQKLNFLGSGHIMGTTVMGKTAASSVVDEHCRSHDHGNLFVLGSSVFPTSSSANPTSTLAALALRAADTIKRQLRTGG
jgi:choline dehydrogenase-like flavoprotein